MISHYFKLAKKTIIKNKHYTAINVFGLVCGMLSALVIAKYVGGSLHFDSFHVKRDRIYSITQEESLNSNPPKESKATYWGAGDLIKQYPEVLDITRYSGQVEYLVQTDGEKGSRLSFLENKVYATDSSFLRIFTFPFIHGDAAPALSRINSVVLTKSTSKKYFGDANPVGRVLTLRVPWGEERNYEIAGVVEDVPFKSRFMFDFLISQTSIARNEFWTVPDCSTFVLLRGEEKSDELAKKLVTTLDLVEQLKATNRKATMSLESIANIQLTNTEYLLVAVGVFIVMISWINYINQVIAQSYLRIKQIAILRVMGSTKANLKAQFIVESSLTCMVSLILIIAIYLGIEPSLQSLTNNHMLSAISDPTTINFIFIAILLPALR